MPAKMNLVKQLGFVDAQAYERHRMLLRRYLDLRLTALGVADTFSTDAGFTEMANDFLTIYREKSRLLQNHLPPVDQRIQHFLDDYLVDLPDDESRPRLPARTLVLDRHGLARELSLPQDQDRFKNSIIESYRVSQGVLHNPVNDRRTTQGVFHIAAGGLPVPSDKREVPKLTYARLLKAAFRPPEEYSKLPYLSTQLKPTHCWVSTLLRPVVCPDVPGRLSRKTMEIRFFAPGSMVANLDFVESIFGNAGDPYLPDNDAALDVMHWTGNTGCVILAPHLVQLRKKDLGLPHISQATKRQIRDRMCWEHEDELYNDGSTFKLTARTHAGVMVTLISDNYFGYCKKEVKTQIGYAANLYGLAEEEHAGGAVAFASFNLGERFQLDSRVQQDGHTFSELCERFGSILQVQPEGYAIDKNHPSVFYIPEDAVADLLEQRISWLSDGLERQIRLTPYKTYIYPCGYKIRLEKHPGAPTWRIIGTEAEGAYCHKPCTVSGGGKSEISKSINDSLLYGPIFVGDFLADMDAVQAIFDRDYSDRLLPAIKPDYGVKPSRSFLDTDRTLGSVIKLLSPSPSDFTPEYNQWLAKIPNRIRALAFVIKRLYHPEWGRDWRQYFSVDQVNGEPGHELKYKDRKLMGTYLRVGVQPDGAWRTYKLRQDFIAADKIQREDDITASIVVPVEWLDNGQDGVHPSLRIVENCEYRLFQRPDEAIHRGYDKQAEGDMASHNVFFSNYHPLTQQELKEMVEDIVNLEKFTPPMRQRLIAASQNSTYGVCSALPRFVDGEPSKNPRYLQNRPDLDRPIDYYVAELGTRLLRRIDPSRPLIKPVDAVLVGRRNNPPEPRQGIRSLAVYNPIHFQELPELFMDFVCSLTGKSPSTTGIGSEGALTKGPFNAIRATADLNSALVSYVVAGYNGFSTAAGYVGPRRRVDHDISLLIPEFWARLPKRQRNPFWMIREGHLEKLNDFEHNGRMLYASRLGYRITAKFVHTFFGKVFDNPATVFDEEMLKPEIQDFELYVDGIENIQEAMQRVALGYFEDGSIEEACPPLAALLHIMAYNHWQGKDAQHPEFRALFTRENLLESDWYRRRLRVRQQRESHLWARHIASLERFIKDENNVDPVERLGLRTRLQSALKEAQRVNEPGYIDYLVGTIGADPMGQDM